MAYWFNSQNTPRREAALEQTSDGGPGGAGVVFARVYACKRCAALGKSIPPSFPTRTAERVQILALHLLGGNLAVTILSCCVCVCVYCVFFLSFVSKQS